MELFTNINPQKLINPDYIFEKTPPANSGYIYLSAIFGIFMLMSIFFWFRYGRLKTKIPAYAPMQFKMFNLFFYSGLIGLMLIFFRWQEISYLGSRLFMIVLLGGFIIWSLYLIFYRVKVIPKAIIRFREKENFNKYLPNPKRISN